MTLEIVDKFYYLGIMISAVGGAEQRLGLDLVGKRFREFLLLFITTLFLQCTNGRVFETCVRSIILYDSETLGREVEVKEDDLNRLERNAMRTVGWMCNVSLNGTVMFCRVKGPLWIRKYECTGT